MHIGRGMSIRGPVTKLEDVGVVIVDVVIAIVLLLFRTRHHLDSRRIARLEYEGPALKRKEGRVLRLGYDCYHILLRRDVS